MTISTCVAKLLDLPSGKAMQEAKSKLNEVYLIVNGSLIYVFDVAEDYLTINIEGKTGHIPSRDVKSMEVWVPETGVYFRKETKEPVYLERKARRQWKRSFAFSFYDYAFFDHEFPLVEIDPQSHTRFWVNSIGRLFFLNLHIGQILSPTEVSLKYEVFSQEALDWLMEGGNSVKGTKKGI